MAIVAGRLRQGFSGRCRGTESTSMTRRIHAFLGAFRGTVFNPNDQPVVFLVPASMAEEVRMLLQGGALPEEEL